MAVPKFEETEELAPSFDETEPVEFDETEPLTLSAQQQFEAGAPGTSFVSAEKLERIEAAKGPLTQARGISLRTGGMLGGLPQRAAAALSAGAAAVGEELAERFVPEAERPDDKTLRERFKENYKTAIKHLDRVQEEAAEARPIIQSLGDGLRYWLDPLGKVVRAKTALKAGAGVARTALATGAEVATVEGQEAVVRTIERTAGGEDFQAVLADEAKELGMEISLGFGAGGALRFAAAPIASVGKGAAAAGRFIATKTKERLAPISQKIIDDLPTAARIAPKAQQVFKESTQKLADAYVQARNVLRDQITETSERTKPLVVAFARNQENVLDHQAKDLIEHIARKSPKGIEENLRKTAKILDKFDETVQHNYGLELDRISEQITKSVDISEAIGVFRRALVNSDEFLIDEKGLVQVAKPARGRVKDALDFLNNEVLSRDIAVKPGVVRRAKLTFKEAARLNQLVGKAVKWGKGELSEGDQALKDFWFDLADRLGDEKIIGAAATRYQPLKNAYREVLELNGQVRAASRLFKTAARATDEESFLRHLTSVVKNLEKVKGISTKLGDPSKITRFAPDDAKLINKTLEDARKLVDIKVATKASTVKTALKRMAQAGTEITDDTVAKVRPLMDDFRQVEAVRTALRNQRLTAPIQDALENPFNKIKAEKALKYVDEYVGPDKAAIKATLNRVAKFERLAGIPDSDLAKLVGEIRKNNLMPPDELMSLELGLSIDKNLAKIFKDADLADALIKANPRVFEAADITRFTHLGIISGVTGRASLLALTLVPVLWRTIKNPTALALLLERAGKPGFLSREALLRVSKLAQDLGTLTVATSKTREAAVRAPE